MLILNKAFPIERTFRNSIYIFFAKFSFVLSSLFISVMAARKLGVTGFGIFTLIISLYTMVELLATFGFDNIIIREVSSDHSKSKLFFSHGSIIGIVSSGAGALLLIILSWLMQYPPEIKIAIYQVCSLLFPSFLYYLLENIFIGMEKSKYVFISALCRDTALVVLGMFVLSMGWKLDAVISAMFMARIIGLACLLCFAIQQRIGLFASIDIPFLNKISKLIPTFLWIGISSCVFLEMDTVILSKILTISELGIYNLAKRILRVGNVFYFSVAMASYPAISQAFSKSKEDLTLVYQHLMKRMFILSVSLVFLALLFAGPVIYTFFGEQYMPAMRYVKVLIWAIIPLSFSLLLSRFLIAAHQQNKDLLSTFLGVIILLWMGITFSIRWGGMGMALAYTVSSFIMGGFFFYFTRRLFRQVG